MRPRTAVRRAKPREKLGHEARSFFTNNNNIEEDGSRYVFFQS